MRVVICGAGQVGFNVASYLSRDHNDITVVDTEQRLIDHVTSELDVNGVVGHFSSPEVLSKAGLADADMIIAVGPHDDVNMVTCQVAHSLFDTPKKIARIRNQDYLDPAWNNLFSKDHMPIDMVISPEVEVAKSIYERLMVTGATESIPVCQNGLNFIGVLCGSKCSILNTPLRQLKVLFPNFFINIVSILRNGSPIELSGDAQIILGDEVFFVVEAKNIPTVMSYFGVESLDSRNIVVLGGGRVGASLSRLIAQEMPNTNVIIIEENEKRAHELAEEMDNQLVIQGDGLQQSILEESEVGHVDTFIAVTNDDEVNAICSLQAKHMGAKRAITLVKNSAYISLLLATKIDTVVSPQDITVSKIMHHVRRGRVKAVHKIRAGHAELIEAVTSDTCKIINQPIKDLHLPHGIRIASIKRDGLFIFPDPQTVIKSGDLVIIFAYSKYAHKVDSYFGNDMDLF